MPCLRFLLAATLCCTFIEPAQSAMITVNQYVAGQGAVTSYNSPTESNPEVVAVGTYETDEHALPGFVSVTVAPPSDRMTMVPIILILSSVAAETWQLELEAGVKVSEIILNGTNQSLTGNRGVSVIAHSLGLAYARPAPTFAAAVDSFVGIPVTSFASAYLATDFTVVGTPVPEPSTLILAALGGLALLAYRRCQ
jgi:hypothetical protein